MSDNGSKNEAKGIRIEDIPDDAVSGMKEKHILWAIHYFETDNKSKSARLAGWKPSTASTAGQRMSEREDVQGLLAYLGKHAIQNSGLDPEWVLEKLKRIAEYGLSLSKVLGPGGKDTGRTAMVDTTASLRALELLGKYQNMWGGELVQIDASTKVAVLGAGSVMDSDQWEKLAGKYIPVTATNKQDA